MGLDRYFWGQNERFKGIAREAGEKIQVVPWRKTLLFFDLQHTGSAWRQRECLGESNITGAFG